MWHLWTCATAPEEYEGAKITALWIGKNDLGDQVFRWAYTLYWDAESQSWLLEGEHKPPILPPDLWTYTPTCELENLRL